jgi:hypothetical protein
MIGDGCHVEPAATVPPSRIPRMPRAFRNTAFTRSRDVLAPVFDAKKRIVGRVRLTQNWGVVAAPPVGMDSECESLAAVTLYDSFPLTTRAPPARSQPFVPFSNEPPCMSEYDAPSPHRMNGWMAGG